MVLKHYQKEVVEKTYNFLIENNDKEIKDKKRILIQMPTGTGKTYVLAQLAYKYYKYKIKQEYDNRHILILSHRKIIINQILNLFKKNVNTTIEELEYGEHSNSPISISTIQRAFNILKKNKRKFGLIIVDEAHHIVSEQYQKLLNFIGLDNTELIGFTATPLRLDGKSLSPTFNELITSKQIIEFIKEGHLSNYEHYVSSTYRIDNNMQMAIINKSKNDVDLNKYDKIISRSTLIADIVENYVTHCSNNKTLIYAINIKHAEEIKIMLDNISGCKIDIIHSNNGTIKTRQNIIDNFKKDANEPNSINTLINVEMFTEGFDLCALDNVILARPTYSLSLYLQMMGRALRKDERNPKKIAKIIDIVNNAQFHGYISTHREWSLYNFYNEPEFELSENIDEINSRKKVINSVNAVVTLQDSSQKNIYTSKHVIVYRPYLHSTNKEIELNDEALSRVKLESNLKDIYNFKLNKKTSNDVIILKPKFLIIDNKIKELDDNCEFNNKIFMLNGVIENDVDNLLNLIFKYNTTKNEYKIQNNTTTKFNDLAKKHNLSGPVLMAIAEKSKTFRDYFIKNKFILKSNNNIYDYILTQPIVDLLESLIIKQKK